jgi:hypothetical protein
MLLHTRRARCRTGAQLSLPGARPTIIDLM